jgi:hypothetical protein
MLRLIRAREIRLMWMAIKCAHSPGAICGKA